MFHIFMGLQDSFSSSMWEITSLHDWAIVVILGVVSLVGYMLVGIWLFSFPYGKFIDSESIEIVWTFVPMVVLFVLSLLSLRVLYMLEEVASSELVVKIIGHQWYWSYESNIFNDEEYSSYLIPSSELMIGDFRLLEVDNGLALPVGVESRLLVTSEDVIHSWAIPSLGVKVDGIPGRLNQIVVNIIRSGVVYGQCSEICGSFHSFMPINVECFSV